MTSPYEPANGDCGSLVGFKDVQSSQPLAYTPNKNEIGIISDGVFIPAEQVRIFPKQDDAPQLVTAVPIDREPPFIDQVDMHVSTPCVSPYNWKASSNAGLDDRRVVVLDTTPDVHATPTEKTIPGYVPNPGLTMISKTHDDFATESTVTAGSFTIGFKYTIKTVGTTDFKLIGATSNTIGVKFIATGVGVGTGTATHLTYTYDDTTGVAYIWTFEPTDNQFVFTKMSETLGKWEVRQASGNDPILFSTCIDLGVWKKTNSTTGNFTFKTSVENSNLSWKRSGSSSWTTIANGGSMNFWSTEGPITILWKGNYTGAVTHTTILNFTPPIDSGYYQAPPDFATTVPTTPYVVGGYPVITSTIIVYKIGTTSINNKTIIFTNYVFSPDSFDAHYSTYFTYDPSASIGAAVNNISGYNSELLVNGGSLKTGHFYNNPGHGANNWASCGGANLAIFGSFKATGPGTTSMGTAAITQPRPELKYGNTSIYNDYGRGVLSGYYSGSTGVGGDYGDQTPVDVGAKYVILFTNGTNYTSCGAPNNNKGTVFIATGQPYYYNYVEGALGIVESVDKIGTDYDGTAFIPPNPVNGILRCRAYRYGLLLSRTRGEFVRFKIGKAKATWNQGAKTLTLSSDTPNCTFFYSLNGSSPTTTYTAPISLTSSATVRWYATRGCMEDSDQWTTSISFNETTGQDSFETTYFSSLPTFNNSTTNAILMFQGKPDWYVSPNGTGDGKTPLTPGNAETIIGTNTTHGFAIGQRVITPSILTSQKLVLDPYVYTSSQIEATGLQAGRMYKIISLGTTNFMAVGAVANEVGTYFIATGAGTGTGRVYRSFGIISFSKIQSGPFVNCTSPIVIDEPCRVYFRSLNESNVIISRNFCQPVFLGKMNINASWDETTKTLTLSLVSLPKTAGSFVVGTTYKIRTIGSTNFTLIGASSNIVGNVFTATGVGSGDGTATLNDISDGRELILYTLGSSSPSLYSQPIVLAQTIIAGSFIVGKTYKIKTIGSTDFTLIGASSNTVGVVFTSTGQGIGDGTATEYGLPSVTYTVNSIHIATSQPHDFKTITDNVTITTINPDATPSFNTDFLVTFTNSSTTDVTLKKYTQRSDIVWCSEGEYSAPAGKWFYNSWYGSGSYDPPGFSSGGISVKGGYNNNFTERNVKIRKTTFKQTIDNQPALTIWSGDDNNIGSIDGVWVSVANGLTYISCLSSSSINNCHIVFSRNFNIRAYQGFMISGSSTSSTVSNCTIDVNITTASDNFDISIAGSGYYYNNKIVDCDIKSTIIKTNGNTATMSLGYVLERCFIDISCIVGDSPNGSSNISFGIGSFVDSTANISLRTGNSLSQSYITNSTIDAKNSNITYSAHTGTGGAGISIISGPSYADIGTSVYLYKSNFTAVLKTETAARSHPVMRVNSMSYGSKCNITATSPNVTPISFTRYDRNNYDRWNTYTPNLPVYFKPGDVVINESNHVGGGNPIHVNCVVWGENGADYLDWFSGSVNGDGAPLAGYETKGANAFKLGRYWE